MRAPQRNRQVVRQWRILRRLAAAKRGNSLYALARDLGVHPRTIRRDLEALQAAGFPLVDELAEHEAPRMVWRLIPARIALILSSMEVSQ